MDFFEEISEVKKDFPKVNSTLKDVRSYQLNFYQVFAIAIFVICFFLGFVLGNLFTTCETTSYFYSDVCVVKQFNFSLMVGIWFFSLLICVFFFAIGHIISILTEICKKK